ncbi:DUF5692 family protein [Caulobacter segnis]|uniref:DUF5692 family protein n=1 Tax=Caulobacter segnis TaxID=88688 RepID=UPI001CBD04DB|nr:DUF5692 family protein [Caulobacter segnis]UAL10176.1 DUF5692 family protein [Caulobacter segnis]
MTSTLSLDAAANASFHSTRRRRGFWPILALLAALAALFCLAPSARAADTPEGHARWMGALEGSDAHLKGASILYDFTFSDGEVSVAKSAGVHREVQVFKTTPLGKGLVLSGDPAGPIPELAGAVLEKHLVRHFKIKLPSGATLELRPTILWLSWLHYAFFFGIILLAGNELARHKKWATYTLYFVFPIVLIPLWMHAGFDGLFRWTKLYSAIFGAAVFTLYRHNGLDRFKWMGAAVAGILAINIFEAVTQDYASGHLANYLNAAAGVLNIVTISWWTGIKRDENKPHDMLWPGMTAFWIIAYDAWNITFVYLNFPTTIFYTVAVVVAPTLAALFIKKGTWMQARAYTLAIYMMYIFSFKALAEQYLGLHLALPLPRNEGIAMTMALISVGLNLVYAILYFTWKFTGRAPARLEVGQHPSVI